MNAIEGGFSVLRGLTVYHPDALVEQARFAWLRDAIDGSRHAFNRSMG